MEYIVEFLVNFIVIFILIYVFYYFCSVRKARKNGKKVPVEVQYLLIKYQINLKKIKYKKFVNSVALLGSFDIALVGSIVMYFNNIFFQLLIGFALFIPIILISFKLVGKYYQKKLSSEELEEIEEIEIVDKKPKRQTITKEKKKISKGERRNG